ncbi:hypothetical protein ACRPK8_14800 [Exiguobacterium sp. TDN 0502]|uniref:hypothetical protein n=1 Tax=Exiguobacterium sp. TDN 0502 TaxID=3420731 RepID=UPI003D77C230
MDIIWVGLMIAFGVISVISKAADKKPKQTNRTPSKEFGEYVKQMVEQVDTARQDTVPPPVVRKKTPAKKQPGVTQTKARPVHERTDLQKQLEQRQQKRSKKEMPGSTIGEIQGSIADGAIGTSGRSASATTLSQDEMRRAIIWSEVLGAPVSKRKR